MPMLVRTRRFHNRSILPPFTKVRDTLAEILVLISIFVLSYLIRHIGLNFGDPLIIHTDEPNILIPVYNMTVNRTFNPDNFIRPDQILYTLNFIYLNIVSLVKTGQVLSVTFPSDPFFYYYSARILIAVFGSLIPVIAYQIGKECSIKYAIPAALLFMFFPSYVNHSHYVTPDVPITLFTLIILLFSIRYIRSKKVENLYLATIFVAINTAEKYPGVIAFGVLLFAIIWVNAPVIKTNPCG